MPAELEALPLVECAAARSTDEARLPIRVRTDVMPLWMLQSARAGSRLDFHQGLSDRRLYAADLGKKCVAASAEHAAAT